MTFNFAMQVTPDVTEPKSRLKLTSDARDLIGVVDALPAMVHVLATSGRVVHTNQLARETFSNADGESVYGESDYLPDMLPWRAEEAARRSLIAAIGKAAKGEASEFETELGARDVRRLVVAVTVAPALDAAGKVRHIVVSATDITGHHAAARTREERLRLALESARMGIWDWNIRENKMEWAANLEFNFGLERNTFGGTYEALLELVHEGDRERLRAEVSQALAGGGEYKIEYRAVRPDGEVRWMCTDGRIVKDEDGRRVRMLGINVDITERKLAEEKRREAEAMLATALRTSREGFVLLRLRDEMFIDVNEGWLETTGFDRAEVIGKTSSEVNAWGSPADQKRFADAMQEFGAVQDFEFSYRHKSGELRQASFSAEIVSPRGEPCALIIGRDITEQKQAREALRESEARLRRLVESNVIGVIFADFQGRITMANDAYLQITGYNREDFESGKVHWTQMTPPEYRPKDELAMAELVSAGKCTPFEKEYCRKDGSRVPILIGIALLEEGKDKCVAFILDLTERQRAETALAQSENRLRTIIETEPECVKIIGLDHTLLEMNPAGLKMIEAESLEQVQGHSVLSIVAPAYRAAFQSLTQRVLRGETGTLEFEIVGLKGRHGWLETHAVPLRDREDKIIALLGLTRDITDRRLAENDLKASREQLRNLTDRLQLVREEESTRIARELHDELGQALTGVVIDLSWLEEKIFDQEHMSRSELISKIRSATKLAQSTVDTVRRIATELRPALLDDFGVAAAIEWQAQEFQQRMGIPCEVESSLSRAPSAQVSTAVFRIFQEALTNIARHAGASRVRITLREVDDSVWLEVSDDGRGITEADLVKARSLGLTGMRERALLLGGSVRIVGVPGQGTTVSVSIPSGFGSEGQPAHGELKL